MATLAWRPAARWRSRRPLPCSSLLQLHLSRFQWGYFKARWNIEDSCPLVQPMRNGFRRHQQVGDALPAIHEVFFVPKGNTPAIGAGFYRQVRQVIDKLLHSGVQMELLQRGAPEQPSVG